MITRNLLIKSLVLLWYFSLIQFKTYSQPFESINKANISLLSKLVEEGNIAGLAVAVYYKNNLIWSEEYGYVNLEYELPTTDESKFRIASVSKLFTGTAILKLHQTGKLDLDDKISKYLDSIPDAWSEITIRQLAQHSSGIGHYLNVKDALDIHQYESSYETIKKISDRPLVHPPDQGVTYSSYAYTVLAAVIEAVTGKSYAKSMREIVFAPLGMSHTELDHQKHIIKGRTGFYQYTSNRNIEHAPYINLSGRWAGSGYLSTAKDLAKFGAAHTWNSNFFTKDELDLLSAPRQINDTLSTKEGLGWGQRFDWDGRLMYWGDGRTPGSTCGLLVFPEQDLSIAIVSNIRNAPVDRGEFQIIATRLLSVIEGKSISPINSNDLGRYNLEIKIGANSFTGELQLQKGDASFIDFKNIQKFEIADAFWIDDDLWIFAIGGGKPPIVLGILPMKLQKKGDSLTGEIYRVNAKIEARKI